MDALHSVLAALAGCHAYTLDIDGQIAQRAARPVDLQQPIESPPENPPMATPESPAPVPRQSLRNAPRRLMLDPDVILVEGKKETTPEKAKQETLLQKLTPDKKLIGYEVPDIKLAPADAPKAEREAAIKKQFPPLPKIPELPDAKLGPAGRPFTLPDLQQMALSTNPLIRQAHLDVEAARGGALQAGLYPNPTFSYEGATIGQGNNNGQRSPGQQGGSFEQTIVTMGKLKLAREAALRDVQITEQKLKQAESDLQSQVRARYFAVLSAQKNFETTRALAQLTESLYNVLLLQLMAGEVAAYEPMQVRVLALQSGGSLVQAHNRYVAAWKQLAATLGSPTMTLTAVVGQIDMPVPLFDHDKVLAHVLGNHTDVISAQFAVEKGRLLTRLAEVQPYPDVTVHVAVQKDYTTPPFGSVANVNVGVPFPLWNRNQGNIQQARAQWQRAAEDNQRIRNELTSRVAEVFERYENNRVLLKLYKDQILPNQVQAFRAAVARHAAVGDQKISYNDLVTSQQTLAALINTYLGTLSDQWMSVVDISNLLQTSDLFQVGLTDDVAPVPDVHEIVRGRLHFRR